MPTCFSGCASSLASHTWATMCKNSNVTRIPLERIRTEMGSNRSDGFVLFWFGDLFGFWSPSSTKTRCLEVGIEYSITVVLLRTVSGHQQNKT